jgi:hypothetical protein
MRFIKRIEVIDGYSIIKAAYARTVDPEKTKLAVMDKYHIQDLTELEHSQEALDELTVYSPPLQNEEIITEEEYLVTLEKLKGLEEHQQIAGDGAIILDNRGLEYWIKNSQKWTKEKIETIGVPIPEGAIRPEAITPEQQMEISAQQEAERIAALTPEQREVEKVNAIQGAKSAARIRKEEAEIADEPDDSKAWFQQRKAEILAKYGATV